MIQQRGQKRRGASGSAVAQEAPRQRRRRKEARPSEITAAALELFAERGFAATRLDDVAKRAGVSKGTLFVYFSTKEDLFRAVARSVLEVNLDPLLQAAAERDRPLMDFVPALLAHAAQLGETRIPAMMRLLIAEARLFPDLARTWHDEVASKVLAMLAVAIERAQVRGEVVSGDPRLLAFSIIGPLLAGVLFREVFKGSGAALPDLHALASQHASAILHGLLPAPSDGAPPDPASGRA